MMKKLKLLPLSIVIMSMVLGVKIVDFSFGVSAALAASSEPAKEEPQAEPGAQHEEKAQAADETEAAKAPSRQLSSNPSRKEIEYLQKLSDRRAELDRRSREIDDREKLLKAVELRIIERTKSLKKIEQTIEAALEKRDEREKLQLQSLVKMYTAMKPKEAARIFDDLEDDILLSIVENMKEKKMGAILAKMNLKKAKKLTNSLATREKLPEIKG